jgi:hypothetical protein
MNNRSFSKKLRLSELEKVSQIMEMTNHLDKRIKNVSFQIYKEEDARSLLEKKIWEILASNLLIRAPDPKTQLL